MRRIFRGAAVLAVAVLVGSHPAPARSPAEGARLTFRVSVAGLPVLSIVTVFRLGPTNYRIDALSRTVGVAGFFHPGEQLVSTTGTWAGGRAVPRSYASIGRWSGIPRRVVIGYAGGQPVIRDHVAPPGQKSLPIPPGMLTGASNLPSAFAEMIRNAQTSGRCETRVRAFDGRVLSEVVSRSAGEVELHEPDFSGPALRCDYKGYALAGLPPNDQGDGPAPSIQSGTIWLGQILPGYPRLPVQLSFLTRWFGEVTAHLIAAQPVPAASVATIDPHS